MSTRSFLTRCRWLLSIGLVLGLLIVGLPMHAQKMITGSEANTVTEFGHRKHPNQEYAGNPWNLSIGPNHNVIWQAPDPANVYVRVDDQAPQLFASGESGSKRARLMAPGHVYRFILTDQDGNEVARATEDLR